MSVKDSPTDASWFGAAEEHAELTAERKFDGDTVTGRVGQAATVIAVLTIGVIGLVGIFIFAKVNDALPTISNSNLSDSKTSLVSGFGDAMDLLPVVMIVLIAAVVVTVVSRFR